MRFIKVPAPTYVDNDEKVKELLSKCNAASVIGLDTETISIKLPMWEDHVMYMGIAVDENSRYLIPRSHIHYFRGILADTSKIKVIHNAKFDLHRLRYAGIEVKGPIADTVIMDYLLYEEKRRKLDVLSEEYLKIPMKSYKEMMGKHDSREVKPGHEIWDDFLEYGSLDPYVTLGIFFYLKNKLESIKVWGSKDFTMYDLYWKYGEPQLKILYDMEVKGIKVDTEHLKETEVSLQKEMDACAKEINKIAGKPINPGSTQQIGELLFGDTSEGNYGFDPIEETPTGRPKVDEKILSKLKKKIDPQHEATKIIELVIQYKKASKLKGTYATGLLKNVDKKGFIHTNYMPCTKAGRLSSNGPNLQNIPGGSKDTHNIRGAFIADDENCVLIGVDYSQLEWRVMAHFSEDESLLNTFIEGKDQHSVTAALIMGISYEEFIERYKAGDPECLKIRKAGKAVSFGILYGAKAWTVANSLSDALGYEVSVEYAQELMDKYMKAYAGVIQQIHVFQNRAKSTGKTKTILGRNVHFPDINNPSWSKKNHALNQAINCPIQGSAADIVTKAMISCVDNEELKQYGCTLRLQIHDELIFNCPRVHAEKAAKIIQDLMENPFTDPLIVPLEADPEIGLSWGEIK